MKAHHLALRLMLSVITWLAPPLVDAATPKVHIELRLLCGSRTVSSELSSATVIGEVAPGQKWVGSLNGDFRGSVSTGDRWPRGYTPDYVWRAEARLVAVEIETMVLEVNWVRTGDDGKIKEVSAPRILRLLSGVPQVLDLVQQGDTEARLEVTASIVDVSPYAGASLDYDLWLVHESASGHKASWHLQITGGQGQWRAFSFKPIGFELDGPVLKEDQVPPVALNLTGEILGRLRGDRTIALVLKNRFGLQCSVAGTPATGGGGQGMKEVVVAEDEAVGIELPTSLGGCNVTPALPRPPNARPGLTASGTGLRVTASQFFAGDRFSLVIRARQRK